MAKGDSTLDYGFRLVLKIRHPTLGVEAWARAFRKKPGRAWKAGEQRTTPIGRALDGVYKNSYGYWDLAKGRGDVLIRRLDAATMRLAKHKQLIRRWRSTGGSIDYHLCLRGQRVVPVEFPPELLAEMGALGVQLGIEVLLDEVRSA